jgi:hypothetical protein
MKFDRKKVVPTHKQRQQQASGRVARAQKEADSITQLADEGISDGLSDKLQRETRKGSRTSAPKF